MPVIQSDHDIPELAIDVIVMRDDDDAWQRIRDSFAAAGLTGLARFDAVDGACLTPGELQAKLSPRAAYELSVGRRYPYGWVHEGIPSLGAVGCYLSHLQLWKRASKRSVPTLILEQDAEPSVAADELLEALSQTPPDADVTFIGHLALLRPRLMEKFSSRPARGFHVMRPTSDVFCTHAYLVTPGGAAKLAEGALPINAQVDSYVRLLSSEQSGLRMVFHSPSLIGQRTGVPSSIQQSGTTVDYVIQGSMMTVRAVGTSFWNLLCKPWFFIRERFRLAPTGYLFKEKGVPGYLLTHPRIFGLLIRSALPSYDSAATHKRNDVSPVMLHRPGKTIWTYWDQGIETLPAINRLCISTWKHHNPDWTVAALDPSTLFDYLDPSDLPPRWNRIETPQTKSNLVRLALLARHGGVWMDSTILVQQGLDELAWDHIEQQSLDLAGFCTRSHSRDHEDDVFETWFIACKPGSHLIRRWHEVYSTLWKDRFSNSGILADPLFKDVDRKNIDNPQYLNCCLSFQALIQKEPECKEAFFKQSRVIASDDTAFRWQDRHGFSRASGLALLGSEYDPAHFSSAPLLKFTKWPAGELFARLNTKDLLDTRHTLGKLLRLNLPKAMEAGS